jgi:ABC-type Fe3+-hydroxamate transport system substrate-binding protein
MNRTAGVRSLIIAASLVVAAACGSDEPSTSDSDVADSVAGSAASTETDATVATTAGEDAPVADDAAFPVTIEHKFGETTVDAEPERVVSIVGVWSAITAEDYELLSAIAPTVAQPDTYDDYGTPTRRTRSTCSSAPRTSRRSTSTCWCG